MAVLYKLFFGGALPIVWQKRRSRHGVLTMKVASVDVHVTVNVLSTMFGNTHSHIVVDDGTQTYMHKNTAYDDKQKIQCTMTRNNDSMT